MQLIESCVRSPVKVSVGVLLVALFGFVALTTMPKQLTPEVQTPTLTIETRWPGASPQEVEREIIQEQEEFLKSVEGVTKMTSESMDSTARVTMEFTVGTNIDAALLKVSNRLDQVREYPIDADKPVISTSNASDRPIAWFILSTRPASAGELDAFEKEYPEHTEQIALIRRLDNTGLALLKLKEFAEKHPEAKKLLPPDIDVTTYRKFAEDFIEARFERVKGVSNANVIGGREEELQVIVNPQELASRGLTIDSVRKVLLAQNKDTSAGDLWEGKRRFIVRVRGQFRSTEEVEKQYLTTVNGAPVYIRDVAVVREGFKKPDGVVRRFGSSTIAVNAMRETGANVFEVMDGLKQGVKELNERVLEQRHLQLTQVYDETEYIQSAIGLVQENIFIGGALTMIVLMMFLHLNVRTIVAIPLIAATAVAAVFVSPWFFAACLAIIAAFGFWYARGALVVFLAIPTSIIGTFLVLGILNRSLNVISLAGIAFAVGMLVDNAVVVLENIYSHYDRGDSPLNAAIRGTKEVWGAVVASTLTTVAVFVPIIFVQEEAGQLFRDIALAISAGVVLSILGAMTLVPTAAARLFKRRKGGEDSQSVSASTNGQIVKGAPAAGRLAQQTERISAFLHRVLVRPIEIAGASFVSLVTRFNDLIQRHWINQLVVTLVFTVGTLSLFRFLPKTEYLPNGNRNLVFGILLPPPGYNLDQLLEMGEKVEHDLRPYWDYDPASPDLGKLDYPEISDFFFVCRGRQVFIGVRARDAMEAGKLVPLVRNVGLKIPGSFVVAKQSSLFEQGLAAGRTVDIEITGPELEKLVGLGIGILGKVRGIIPEAQVIPKPSLDLSNPELHINPRLTEMAEMGMDSTSLGYSVNALVDGAYAADYYVGGDKIDLSIVGQQQFSQRTQNINEMMIATPLAGMVPLNSLADIQLSSGPEQINHRERVRAITIEVSPPENMPIEVAMDLIRGQIIEPLRDAGELGANYNINLAGTADKLTQTWQALYKNLLLALLITYLLMAALFESWLYPFVIILTVPLGAVGGILGLNLLNQFVLAPLDVLTMLGFIILIGTVVNNPILIVHQSLNYMREEGWPVRQAIVESVRTRVRPIFMTTMTTLLGLLPLVLFPGAGSELYRGLGAVLLGGLLVSTMFTLILVPAVFRLTMDARAFVIGLFGLQGEETGARKFGDDEDEETPPPSDPNLQTPTVSPPVVPAPRERQPASLS